MRVRLLPAKQSRGLKSDFPEYESLLAGRVNADQRYFAHVG